VLGTTIQDLCKSVAENRQIRAPTWRQLALKHPTSSTTDPMAPKKPRNDLDALEAEQPFPSSDFPASTSPPAKAKGPRPLFPKLDDNALLDESKGFAFLTKNLARAGIRGARGGEEKDLEALLRMYRKWNVVVFPKLTFDDFVPRLENVCKASKGLRVR
jgi:hypothetical protein